MVELLAAPAAWHLDALCAEYPADWWFPERGMDGVAADAKRVCGRCLVRVECLNFAMTDSNAYLHGVWGGTSPQDRRKLRRAAA